MEQEIRLRPGQPPFKCGKCGEVERFELSHQPVLNEARSKEVGSQCFDDGTIEIVCMACGFFVIGDNGSRASALWRQSGGAVCSAFEQGYSTSVGMLAARYWAAPNLTDAAVS